MGPAEYNAGNEEDSIMPLRDHFHPPLDDRTSWEEFHGGWPMVIVQALARKLPRRYVAGPRVHSGAFVEVDVATFEKDDPDYPASEAGNGGGVATAVWAPARPTLSVTTDLPAQDEFEVRVYDRKRGRRLVAAVEIVSPANKDRPEHRRDFVAKCAALLQQRVSVTIIDLVTNRNFNLYRDLLDFIGTADPSLGPEPPPLLIEAWGQTLTLGQPLPTLPLWLADNLAVPLELEASYEETCRALRIG
jgi:hypothetical protein